MSPASAHQSALPHVRLFPRRRRWVILGATLAATALAATVTPLVTPAPRSEAAGGTVVLTAVTRPAAAQTAAAYRIRPGDTLGGIAARLCGNSSAYRSLAAANGIADPNLIYAGRTLWHVSCHASAGVSDRAARSGGKVWGVTYGFPNYCGDGDGDGWDVPCSSLHRSSAVAAPSYRSTSRSSSSSSSSSSRSYPSRGGVNWDAIAQCESGGNWSTDTGNGFHGGLQFTQSTWNAYGGSGDPANASRSEQIRIAQRVLAGQGIGAWPVCGRRG